MPIQPMNFQTLSPDQANPFFNGVAQGQKIGQSFLEFPEHLKSKILANELAKIQNEFARPMAEEKLTSDRQANEWNPKLHQSQIGLQGAQTNRMNTLTPFEAQQMQQEIQYNPSRWNAQTAAQNAQANRSNQMLPEDLLAQQLENQKSGRLLPFTEQQAQADIDYKKRIGSIGGNQSAGTRDELAFQKSVADDNPHIVDPSQLREAYDIIANGGDKLSDGTPIKTTKAIERAYDRAFKSTTTAPLITAGSRANAASSEIPVLDKYINAGREPYGDTILGKSIAQIKDSMDTKNIAAQNRLGDYIASDVLSFDKAALQTRIAGTESGVTIINEIMNKSKQVIDAKYPTLTNAARERALTQVGKALDEALEARNKYGIRASEASGKKVTKKWAMKDGKLVPEG